MTPVPSAHPLDKTLQSVYLDYFKPIYLIFDQFEELFIFGLPMNAIVWLAKLPPCSMRPLNSRSIFVISEEYLAEMTALEQCSS